MIVSGSDDGTARLWSVGVPELRKLADIGTAVTRVRYGAGGQEVLATGRDGLVHILDAATGASRGTRSASARTRVVTGPNGATAEPLGNVVVLRYRGHTTTLRGHQDAITSAAFSPNGRLLVTASRDNDARIWDVATRKLLYPLSGHLGTLQDAQFSPDGRWVVTAGTKAGIWNVRTGLRLMFVRSHGEPLASATFDPTGHTILTGSINGAIRTYRCVLCGNLDDLLALAKGRLAAIRR
jgi:WD40 repeat protein